MRAAVAPDARRHSESVAEQEPLTLVYITAMLPFGPGETFIIPEITALIESGQRVHIVPVRPRGATMHADALPLVVHAQQRPLIDLGIAAAAVLELSRSPRRAVATLASLRRSRSGRVFLKNLAVVPKGLWLAAQVRKVGADHVHAHWAGTSATLAMIASQLSDVPWSFTAHRWDIVEDNLLTTKARSACFVRAISKSGARALSDRPEGLGAEPAVIHVGVAVAAATAPPARPRAGHGAFTVVTAASFVPVKGHRYLLEAVRMLRDRGHPIALDLAGDGPLLDDVRLLIERLQLGEQVSLLGRLSHTSLLEDLAAGRWDAMVLPSIVTATGEQEGIPVALVEAMAAGVPVVATNIGGIPELVGDGAGLLVPPADAPRLAEALSRLAQDADLRVKLAIRARGRVEQEFAVAAIVTQLLERFRASSTRAPDYDVS